MSKTFLITSHTEGAYPFEQRTILYNLVNSLKHYFPDCFILITSQSDIEPDTQQLVDYVIIDKITKNYPHGAGEIAMLQAGFSVLKQLGKENCYKLVYDFLIDDTNYQVFDQWLSHNKPFVGCYWHTEGLGVGAWCWYGTIEIQEQILNFKQLDMHFECKMLESIQQKNLLDQCYIYDDHNLMFNNEWATKCDLVHAGGTVLKHNYGTVAAAIIITDQVKDLVSGIIYSIVNQSKKPDHLIVVDQRSYNKDPQSVAAFQKLFILLDQADITWNIVHYEKTEEILIHLADLGHGWGWIVNNQTFLHKDSLKTAYRSIISNYEIGTILDVNNNLFYRNRIIEIKENINGLNNFVVDQMSRTTYKNITQFN